MKLWLGFNPFQPDKLGKKIAGIKWLSHLTMAILLAMLPFIVIMIIGSGWSNQMVTIISLYTVIFALTTIDIVKGVKKHGT